MLEVLVIFLICSIIIVSFISKKQELFLKVVGMYTVLAIFLMTIYLLLNFEYHINCLQYNFYLDLHYDVFNLNLAFGVDGFNLILIALSTFLILLCLIFNLQEKNLKFNLLNLLIIELSLVLVFSATDLFLFYFFFEIILIPMFLLIGVGGSRERKIRAGYLFFFYTLIGSFFLLLGIIYIYYKFGTVNILALNYYKFNFTEQYFLWLAFFFSFAFKIPIFPFHVWLPEAHVEAPTVGSVILAGVLLKLGIYGFLKFSLPLFPEASHFFGPWLIYFCVLGVVYASITAMRQTDLKRIIAYSSVAHMNVVVIGIFSFNNDGITGAIFQSLSHGFVSSALFFLIGMLYKRYHNRSIHYYGGLTKTMPIFSALYLWVSLANIALPGTSSFIGELLLFLGIFHYNIYITIITLTSVILCGGYALWLYNRVFFGNTKNICLKHYSDLNVIEIFIIGSLLLCIMFFGIYSASLIKFFSVFVNETIICKFYYI